MSHIKDIIGVVQGIRLVLEAGLKLQQENSRIIWNNCSVKSALQSCTTNPILVSKPNPNFGKELYERALVVVHGFRQYAVMHVPNFNAEIEKRADMDPEMHDEIEELNREFNKTFETLKKSQAEMSTTPPPIPHEFVTPIEDLKTHYNKDKGSKSGEKQKTMMEQLPPPKSAFVFTPEIKPSKSTSTPISEQSTSGSVPKPVAKKKIRTSVSIFFIKYN